MLYIRKIKQIISDRKDAVIKIASWRYQFKVWDNTAGIFRWNFPSMFQEKLLKTKPLDIWQFLRYCKTWSKLVSHLIQLFILRKCQSHNHYSSTVPSWGLYFTAPVTSDILLSGGIWEKNILHMLSYSYMSDQFLKLNLKLYRIKLVRCFFWNTHIVYFIWPIIYVSSDISLWNQENIEWRTKI